MGRGDPTGASALLARAVTLVEADESARGALLPSLGASLFEAGQMTEATRVLDEAITQAPEERLAARAQVERELVRLATETSSCDGAGHGRSPTPPCRCSSATATAMGRPRVVAARPHRLARRPRRRGRRGLEPGGRLRAPRGRRARALRHPRLAGDGGGPRRRAGRRGDRACARGFARPSLRAPSPSRGPSTRWRCCTR